MNVAPPTAAFVEATKRLLDPKCPRFPEISIFVGEIASWASWAASWVGLRLGPLAKLLWALRSRGSMVRWARMPQIERILCMGVVGIAPAAMAIAAVRKGSGRPTAA